MTRTEGFYDIIYHANNDTTKTVFYMDSKNDARACIAMIRNNKHILKARRRGATVHIQFTHRNTDTA